MIIQLEKKENELLVCPKLDSNQIQEVMHNSKKSYVENNFDVSDDPIQFMLDNICEISDEEINAI